MGERKNVEHVRSPEVREDFWGASSRKVECVVDKRSHRSQVEKVKVDLERNMFCLPGCLDFSGKEHLFSKEAVI